MSRYAFDGEMYAGWSTGRWFGLAGVAALGSAWLAREMRLGWMASSISASGQMFAFFVQWVGIGVFCLMAMATLGSIMISLRERGDVEVTEAGVTRIFAPGREKFVPRDEIAALIARPGGGVTLVDAKGREKIVVPRSIVGYRECIAELKAMGIPSRPAQRGDRTSAPKKMTWKEWVQTVGAYGGASICLSKGSALEHMVSGTICLGFFAWMWFDHRRESRQQPVWALPLTMVAGLAIFKAVARFW